MKRKLKRRLLKLIKQQLLDEALPELYLRPKFSTRSMVCAMSLHHTTSGLLRSKR